MTEASEKTQALQNHQEQYRAVRKERLTADIRRLKRRGMSNVLIGQHLGISESTVRRRLNQPPDNEELLIRAMLDSLGDSREDLIQILVENAAYIEMFDRDGLGRYVLKIHATSTDVKVNPTLKKVSFELKFDATIKDEEKKEEVPDWAKPGPINVR